MRPLRSIRWRLQLWYGLLIAVLLAGFALTAYFFEHKRVLGGSDEMLQQLALDLNLAVRRRAPPPRPSDGVRAARSIPIGTIIAEVLNAERIDHGFYAAMWLRNEDPSLTTSPNAPADLPKPPDGPVALRWRGMRREASINTHPGDVALVGRDLAPEFDKLSAFAWQLAGGALALLVLTLAIGSWLVGLALRPIRDISDAATKIAGGDLSRRIDTRDAESELGELAAVLNSTFARLEAAFAQQARFTADAAHELRTPVTVMLTHVQNGLAADTTQAEQREAFEACERAAQRMRRLIESLLQLARLDSGQDATKARLDLADVARESVEHIRPLASPRQIALRTELQPATCFGTAELLGQVVANLVGNAIHHNRDGGEVRVTTRAENGDVFLIVADNGPGIAPEHLPHIFERFYRAEKARTGTSGRTGLGLAISRAIVDAHGGTIEVGGAPGTGATFTVKLPAAERHEAPRVP